MQKSKPLNSQRGETSAFPTLSPYQAKKPVVVTGLGTFSLPPCPLLDCVTQYRSDGGRGKEAGTIVIWSQSPPGDRTTPD